ncbi:MAG: carboxypeptidase-like regulatory domain-containing protein [Terriglobia bacterium]
MALAVVAHGRAQASGSITGTVTDTSGVPVAGVKVTIQDLETNAVRKVTTNSEGRYDAPSLQATVSSTTGHLEKVC